MSNDLNQRIDALDGKEIDYSDPQTYANLLGYNEEANDDPNASERVLQGETEQIQEPAAAPAVSQPLGQSTESSAPPAVAEEKAGSQRFDGVSTKDGKQVIPYAVLQSTRDNLKDANRRIDELQRQLDATKNAGGGSDGDAGGDLAGRAQSDPGSLTQAELDELADDFPQVAKLARALQSQQLVLDRLTQQAAQATSAQQPAQAEQASEEDDASAFDAAIVANPLIGQWMASPHSAEWQRATQIDELLRTDPATSSLSYTERFAKVQRMVAAEFDVEQPASIAKTQAPAASPAAPPHPAAQATAPITSAMPTLTDLGGVGVAVSDSPLSGMTAGQAVDKAMGMSVEQLMALVGVNH